MSAIREREELAVADSAPEYEFTLSALDDVIGTLQADIETYKAENLEGLRAVASQLRAVEVPGEESDEGDLSAEDVAHRDEWARMRDAAADAIGRVVESESVASPWRQCVNALAPRMPRIALFRDEDRRLESRYDLNEVADAPPPALAHLAELAKLELPRLRDEVNAGATADAATRRNASNRILLDVFDKSWNQQGIAIQVEVQGPVLHIHATTPQDEGLSELDDRSDGMRWFAALLAFTKDWSDETILLVDEIERHLHYDAQADLVDVLTRQSFTSKVLYTTHSFGCLPHDLGTGVRVVHPLDAATSRLENGYWKGGSGFSPLLVSMGAAAVSFTPTRHAVIGEGASDAILMPTLLRQACEVDRLGFQVAPGLSSVAAAGISALNAEAGRVAFVVDGDQGGRDLTAMLTRAGITPSRIVALGSMTSEEELEVEDLVDPAIYAEAVTDELRCWQEVGADFTAADVNSTLRTKSLDAWCGANGLSAPDKAGVAQRIVDLAAERDVFSATRQPELRDLLARIRTALDLTGAASS